MWRENLIELKKQKGLTTKQIADKSKLPEKTITRILSGTTANPTIDNILGIVLALDGSLDIIFEIFMGTQAVLGDETLVKLQQECDALKEEFIRVSQELSASLTTITELNLQIKLLEKEIEHKNEIISLHNFYMGRNR